jgi:hypothetical protein
VKEADARHGVSFQLFERQAQGDFKSRTVEAKRLVTLNVNQ